MRKVSLLVENYLTRRMSTFPDEGAPVRVVRSSTDTPLAPTSRWVTLGKKILSKRFEFRDHELRDRFIIDLLEHERDTAHRARVILDELSVEIEVGTRDANMISELDREYAKEADLIYKNVCYT
jgi:pterin-4a-carbinolamine dehydratase